MVFFKKAAAAIIFLGAMMAANADLLTSNTIANPIDINISSLTYQQNVAGPIAIGSSVGEDLNVSGNPNSGIYVNHTSNWGLVGNGNWNGLPLIGADDASPGSLIFSFAEPVSAVGGFMNHAPDQGADLIIYAYDANMNLLETYNVTSDAPIVTPGATNEGGFRGIERNASDIYFFEVYGYVQVLSTFTFTRGVAPEPVAVPTMSEWGLIILSLLMGIFGFIALIRQRKYSA